MTSSIVRRLSPEEEELARKRAELDSLEARLVQRELDLATLHAELFLIERLYLRVVGVMYAELDLVEAEIADALLRWNPSNAATRERAEQAHAQAQRSAGATSDAAHEPVRERPTESIKLLFRKAAKLFHPDLATDESERSRRTHFMTEANRAYEAGDSIRLQTLVEEWEGSHRPIAAVDVGAELVRLIRKIARVQERMVVIDQEVSTLERSQTADLKRRIDEARQEGRDLLGEMAAKVSQQIAAARERLADLLSAQEPR